MAKRFKTVSSLQAQLKESIRNAIHSRLYSICMEVVQKQIYERVYRAYTPSDGEYGYERTFELLNSVDISDVTMGTKHARFEVYMNTDKINPYGGKSWNQHMSTDGHNMDASDYIPLWVEEGTNNSLWDRNGAHYMQQSHFELGGGKLSRELERALRSEGWDVKKI